MNIEQEKKVRKKKKKKVRKKKVEENCKKVEENIKEENIKEENCKKVEEKIKEENVMFSPSGKRRYFYWRYGKKIALAEDEYYDDLN